MGSASPALAPATGTGAGKKLFLNNSALGGHKALPKVANERYCNVVLIFGLIWGSKRQRPKKIAFFSRLPIFLLPCACGTVRVGAQRAPSCAALQPPTGARCEGPIGPQNFLYIKRPIVNISVNNIFVLSCFYIYFS